MESLTPGQMVVKIVDEELTNLMGGEEARIATPPKPSYHYYDGWFTGCR